MNDKSALLGQLKIDRDATPKNSRAGLWLALLACAAAVAAGAWWLRPAPAVPVRAATAQPMVAAAGGGSVLDASGYVVARRQATVSSKVTGKVVELLIEEGQQVKVGQVLARIDDSNARAQLALAQSQLAAARTALAEVRVQLAEAERQLKRTQELAQQKLVSQAALDAAQANVDGLRARLDSTQSNVDVAERSAEVQQRLVEDTVVRAPFAGVITVKNAQMGEMISPLSAGGAGTRTGIGTLVDMESLEIEVDVNENFINRVQAGQPVTAALNAYPEWKIPAAVIAVIPTADRSKATVKVRVAIKDKDPRILPDMGVRVAFLGAETAPAAAGKGVLVPAEAVTSRDGKDVVFVLKGETVERRAVALGPAQAGGVQVLAGLSAGEQVAVGELARLADGARVAIRN
ncbi:MAG: efflux RND transporter periplasmic adaptor subunit [Gammaproteobacteria bacterium]|nr:efflux RND transporter periplasmic adaptor subunit [Gammaproteobacteria bacterium]